MPALATATVIGPSARSAALTSAWTEAPSRTSTGWVKTRAGPSRSAARRSDASLRSPSATVAPARWKASAIPNPMPAPPPVTSTTSSLNSSMTGRVYGRPAAASTVDLGPRGEPAMRWRGGEEARHELIGLGDGVGVVGVPDAEVVAVVDLAIGVAERDRLDPGRHLGVALDRSGAPERRGPPLSGREDGLGQVAERVGQLEHVVLMRGQHGQALRGEGAVAIARRALLPETI